VADQGSALFKHHPAEPTPRRALPERFKAWLGRVRGRPPFTWTRKRKRRWLVALLLLLLAYPVLGTAALWTGFAEWLLKSEDLRVEIQNPSYTIWPGRVRAKNVRILMNGTTQFILQADDIVLDISVLGLLQHKIHATKLTAQNTLYHMRVQVKDTKGIEKRVAAYPPLKDLPGAKVISEKTAQKTEEQDADWTVVVDGIDVGVRELWFFEYRYLGKGHLRGAFTVGPQVMEVKTAVQDLGPGELRFGADETMVRNLRGQITADIPQLNPDKHADASFMELVTARVNLRADVETLARADAYVAGIEVGGGKGPLAVDLYLDRGKLGPKSHFDFQTDALRVKGHGFGVQTDLLLALDAAGSPEGLPIARSSSKSTYVSIARGMRAFTLQIHGHHEEAELDTIQLSRSTDLRKARVRMPTIRSVDLRDLPVLLPEGAPLRVNGGEFAGSLNLDMDEKFWVKGPLKAKLENLQVEGDDLRWSGNLELQSTAHFNPKLQVNSLERLVLSARGLDFRGGDRAVDDWWMDLTSGRLTYWNKDTPAFEGSVSIRARDLEPVLYALAEKDVISELVPVFTSLRDFRAKATLRSSEPIVDLTLASESTVWDAAGRFYKNGERSQMAFVFGGQAVSIGIAKTGDDLDIVPLAKTSWLNERLRDFPKPLVQVSPRKP
jgi:hypothetical protein